MTKTKRTVKKYLALTLALIMVLALYPPLAADAAVANAGGTTQNDEVIISKTAAMVADKDHREYDITLQVQGKKNVVTLPIDLVIVLDLSDSMNNYRGNLRQATNAVLTALLGNGNPNNNRIAIVTYGETTATRRTFAQSSSTAITTNEINDWYNESGRFTNTSAGMRQAYSVLGGARDGATKAVLFMTDGEPNRRHNSSSTAAPSPNPYSDISGSDNRRAYYAAHNEATRLKNASDVVVSVGFNLSNASNPMKALLGHIGKPAGYIGATTDGDSLIQAFLAAAQSTAFVTRNAVVTDIVPADFDVIDLPAGASKTVNPDGTTTITWQPNGGNIASEGNYSLTYRVKAKVDKFSSDAKPTYDTNVSAKINYTYSSNPRELAFSVPKVTLPEPKLAIDKAVTHVNGQPVTGTPTVKQGDTVTYQVTISNPGTLRTQNISVTDSLYPGTLKKQDNSDATGITLAPGASLVLQAYTLTVTGAMINAEGNLVNTATAVGPKGNNYKTANLTAADTVTLSAIPTYPIKITKRDADDSNKAMSGVTFRLYKQQGDGLVEVFPGETFVTNENGVATTGNVPAGAYVLREVTPAGYVTKADIDITVAASGVTNGFFQVAVSNNQLRHPIRILKHAAGSETTKLTGATFKIYKNNNGAKGVLMATLTDANLVAGVYTSADLLPGSYLVEETVAPDGYLLNSTLYPVTIAKGATPPVQLKVPNTPKPQVKVIKTIAENDRYPGEGAALSGVTFNIYNVDPRVEGNENATPVTTVTTGADGTATSGALNPGTYYVREAAAPTGFNPNTEVKSVTLGQGGVGSVSFVNTRIRYDLTLTKTSAIEGYTGSLAGATFDLYLGVAPAGVKAVEGIVIGSANTAVVEDLLPGSYYLVETVAPAGHDRATGTFPVQVGPNEDNARTIVNGATGKHIIIRKGDANNNGAALAGALYSIYDRDPAAEGAVLLESGLATGTDGSVVSANAYQPGKTYYVVETSAPTGYELPANPVQSQAMLVGADLVFTFSNARTPYPIRVTKTDDAGTPVAGVKFEITGGNLTAAIPLTTGVDGKATSAALLPGSYTVTEIEAPNGYELPATAAQPVVIQIGGTGATQGIYEVSFVNARTPYPIRVTKTDDAGAPVEGVKFTITGGNLTTAITLTTGTDGKATSAALLPGSYTVTEVEVPNGYELPATAAQPVVIQIGGTGATQGIYEVSYVNARTPYPIRVTKTDDTGAPVEGVKFTITGGNLTTAITLTTGTDGKATSAALLPGSYTVTEVEAPNGYELPATAAQPVVIQIGGTGATQGIYEVSYVNARTPYPIRVIKTDDTEAPVEGVVFEITGGTLTEAIELTTDEFGEAESDALLPGSYTVTEISAPNGYEPADPASQAVSIQIGGEGAEDSIYMVNFVNDRTLYPIEIIKLDAVDEAPLQGAKFRITPIAEEPTNLFNRVINFFVGLFTEDGSFIVETDENGFATSDPLAPGRYRIEEIEAPAGYELDENPLDVTLEIGNEGNDLLTVTWMNDRTPYPIRVVKTDRDSEETIYVGGATYAIYDDEDAALAGGDDYLALLVTDDEGLATTTATFQPGTYYVVEQEAPNGYELDDAVYPVVIAINQEGGVAVAQVSDPRTPYTIGLLKLDGDDEITPLAGAVFGLYDNAAATGDALEQLTTGADGKAVSADAYKPGTYYLKELTAPTDYELDATIHAVDITIGGGNVEITIYNDPEIIDIPEPSVPGGPVITPTPTETFDIPEPSVPGGSVPKTGETGGNTWVVIIAIALLAGAAALILASRRSARNN